MIPSRESYTPSHPGLFVVDFKSGDFASALVATKNFEVDEVMTSLKGCTKSPKAYSTVQCGVGQDDHLELNSDLVYVNHSCEPNVAFDLSGDYSQWHLRALKPIRAGDFLTFFYPSTEWDMDQPFDCVCNAPSCLGRISGASVLSKDVLLARHFVSPWILAAVAERDRKHVNGGQ
ncbi:hypothetical protein BV25DRAFT_1887393 [Artomyces pyxidatus]|uniref:Uncharacterized protein n=1 Tax=Artomyces pyxidatus TaxID=48021 RepID=A0ACB8SWI6_9AGAM|nr:hypothetical protein BV25DRAFT_1887393 [Artomyces pyxidatus]